MVEVPLASAFLKRRARKAPPEDMFPFLDNLKKGEIRAGLFDLDPLCQTLARWERLP